MELAAHRDTLYFNLAPAGHPRVIVFAGFSGRHLLRLLVGQHLSLERRQLVLHVGHGLLQVVLFGVDDVLVLCGVLLDVEEHELGVLSSRLGFFRCSGRGVVPSSCKQNQQEAVFVVVSSRVNSGLPSVLLRFWGGCGGGGSGTREGKDDVSLV